MTDNLSERASTLPLSIEVDVLDRMLNFEIADDPVYQGIEIQAFDDPRHGSGVTTFLSRRSDDKTDVYFQNGLRLDPGNYAIGGGLGAWVECEFDVARLIVTPHGVDAEIRFTDVEDRLIEVRIADHTRRPRRTAGFLAPMGAAIADPRSMPLVWMSQFDLLRRSGPAPVVRIDGRSVSPGRLPAERLLRRRLIKVASDLFVVSLNPVREDPVHLTPGWSGNEAIVEPGGVRALIARADVHAAVLRFDPPFPDVGVATGGALDSGAWEMEIDTNTVVAGSWHAERGKGQTQLRLEVTRGWPASGLPALMAVVTKVAPVFRRWPTSYRWSATIEAGDPPVMTSGWERVGTERGGSYRALTGSG